MYSHSFRSSLRCPPASFKRGRSLYENASITQTGLAHPNWESGTWWTTPETGRIGTTNPGSVRERCKVDSSNFSHRQCVDFGGQRSFANKTFSRPCFFDYQSTTPVDPRVLDKMVPLYTQLFGNPHSRSHGYGWEAEELVEIARQQVADILNASSAKNIVFTSGATESNNLAIKGVADFYGKLKKEAASPAKSETSAVEGERKGFKYNHIITTQIEHKCVLASCRTLQARGWDVTYLQPNKDGLISAKDVEKAIRPDTLLTSVMFVNNEIGTLQPISEIGAVCRAKKVIFHTDAAQAIGKVDIDVDEMNIDILSISGHKLYGPKGVGALYIRSKPKRIRAVAQTDGGGQERGFRSGTLAAPLVVGLGEACRVAMSEKKYEEKQLQFLFDRLYRGITEQLPDVVLNGSPVQRYFGNINLSFSCVEGESLLMRLQDVAVSSGSACTSESLEPSYVLRAIGVDEELAHTSIRFGIGRFTTMEEVDKCIAIVVKQVRDLREMSPLWESKNSSDGGAAMVWT